MIQTTGYSLSITEQMQVGGRVGGYGTTAFEGIPLEPSGQAKGKRGIMVRGI